MATNDLLTRQESLERLQVKSSTLYAYVSRGLIRRVPHDDPRQSLYSRTDVERLRARRRGRPTRAAAAESSMHWGEPIIDSAITQIGPLGPSYRGRNATELAETSATYEDVAALLLTGTWDGLQSPWPTMHTPVDLRPLLSSFSSAPLGADIGHVAAIVTLALGMHGRDSLEISKADTIYAARQIIQTLTGCLGLLRPKSQFIERLPDEPIAAFAIRATGGLDTPGTRRALDSALILLADHELASATFTARIAASSSANLYQCVAAAISCHLGISSGLAGNFVEEAFFEDVNSRSLKTKIKMLRDHGPSRFGFNHPLYSGTDPRATAILAAVRALKLRSSSLDRVFDLLRILEETGHRPGAAVGLAVLTRALRMPAGSARALWIISRAAGWVAHVIEQRSLPFILRPRARYIDKISNEQVNRP